MTYLAQLKPGERAGFSRSSVSGVPVGLEWGLRITLPNRVTPVLTFGEAIRNEDTLRSDAVGPIYLCAGLRIFPGTYHTAGFPSGPDKRLAEPGAATRLWKMRRGLFLDPTRRIVGTQAFVNEWPHDG